MKMTAQVHSYKKLYMYNDYSNEAALHSLIKCIDCHAQQQIKTRQRTS